MELLKHLIPITKGKAVEENIILGEGFRITVLSEHLLRLEVNLENKFEDRPTQMFWFRDFPKVDYKTVDEGFYKKIITKHVTFYYHYNKRIIETVSFNGGLGKIYAYNKENLKGTARTLDGKFGPIKLNDGILSKRGITIIEDYSLAIDEKGLFCPRANNAKDEYFFAHKQNYLLALKEFFRLSGESPLIPRYALGNWWSRYRAYTDKEYLEVIENFKKKKVPLSVATIDMDWHYTDIKEEFGSDAPKAVNKNYFFGGGWTGYTFNRKLFPDYKKFLQTLKDENLKITLNLHPAAGIRFFEEMYPAVCKKMGVDPSSKQPIEFDITDPNFINTYFEDVHHPYENDGVDFWWLDWQQGKKTKIKGLDPLYALNHYHYLDNARKGNLPLTLSRYAGIGSHRYPLGFSGDSAMNWKILNFIPYFTANASNVGYTWWSHDIGGHHMGIKDDELYIRWIEFGVFNPIMRLHSTSHDLFSKEPWCYNKTAELIVNDYLRLRHKLIPYIYSMNVLNNVEGQPLVMPMYYLHPKNDLAYNVPNQYYFGSELIVHPITHKVNKRIQMGRAKTFIPKGRWTDIFTGYIYEGQCIKYLYRDIYSIPVLAKEGAIIPLNGEDVFQFGVALPKTLELWIYRGNNSFTLYEDSEDNAKRMTTLFENFENDNKITFIKNPCEGDLITSRDYVFTFKDVINAKNIIVKIDNNTVNYESIINNNLFQIKVKNIKHNSCLAVILEDIETLKNPKLDDYRINLLSKMQGSNIKKMINYQIFKLKKKPNKKYNCGKFINTAFEELKNEKATTKE